MISGDNASQFPSQSQDPRIQTQGIGSRSDSFREELNHSSICNKKARLLGDDSQRGLLSCGVNRNDPIWRMTSTENNIAENIEEVSHAIPYLASAIEDLLEQTSKIHDLKSPEGTACDPQSAFGLSKHWINRADKKDDIRNHSEDLNPGIYDGFSEIQTESQVVGYEEDLSGRQMIIDRVWTRSSMT
ncbi:uncharacterized protein LOC132311132 [Cornus florida]|uniref:uncharacterized protein LOC132311132 n=1 Tax=Cornus florida TaxID=4283 RepID=UPI00289D65BE|nr:uncharacterized protein LOC132311132 [Cornus florida]